MDEVGFTSLHMAADNGHAEIVDILLEAGAKLNPQDSCTAQTPLIMAINKVQTPLIMAIYKVQTPLIMAINKV